MPIVTVDLIAGYDNQAKARLGRDVTRAVMGVVDCPADLVTVILRDVPPANYMRAGIQRQPGPALPDPEGVVRAYLAAMETRDLARAKAHLHSEFLMTFPGPITLTRLEDLVAWAKPRYRFVTKTYTRFDAMGDTVYCLGTLAGEWPDGTPFSGIRFIDRFELSGGLIRRQDVWNDIAETRANPQE